MTQERDSAKKIIEILERGVSGLDQQTRVRLAAARGQAVAAMEGRALAARAELAHASSGRHVAFFGRHAWMTPLIALVIVLLVVAVAQKNWLISSSGDPVEADALLLASDLPPEAYVDKGFDAWLENSSEP